MSGSRPWKSPGPRHLHPQLLAELLDPQRPGLRTPSSSEPGRQSTPRPQHHGPARQEAHPHPPPTDPAGAGLAHTLVQPRRPAGWPYLAEAALPNGTENLEVVQVHCRENRGMPGEVAERPCACHEPPRRSSPRAPLRCGQPPTLQGAPAAFRQPTSPRAWRCRAGLSRGRGGSWGPCSPSCRTHGGVRPGRTAHRRNTIRQGSSAQPQAPRSPPVKAAPTPQRPISKWAAL